MNCDVAISALMRRLHRGDCRHDTRAVGYPIVDVIDLVFAKPVGMWFRAASSPR